jgi:hypothetical protein
MNHDVANGAKLAAVSVASSLTSIPLEDTTQVGQIISILIGIVSGIASLVKLFKRKK